MTDYDSALGRRIADASTNFRPFVLNFPRMWRWHFTIGKLEIGWRKI